MSSLQRKIVAFLFLLIVAVPVFLSLKFILEESLILLEVDEKMETETLQSVKILKKDAVWVKAGKEILLEGQLFDIKNTEAKDDTLFLTGYFDIEETELLSGFKKYTDSNNRDTPLGKPAFKFLFSPVFNNQHELFYGSRWFILSNQYALFSEALPAAPCLSFNHPPRVPFLQAA